MRHVTSRWRLTAGMGYAGQESEKKGTDTDGGGGSCCSATVNACASRLSRRVLLLGSGISVADTAPAAPWPAHPSPLTPRRRLLGGGGSLARSAAPLSVGCRPASGGARVRAAGGGVRCTTANHFSVPLAESLQCAASGIASLCR